ncbi:MAG: hypothetical protein LKJ83_09385 [Eubacteriaceae bacterium]|jgi:hypothetical protein|nr:hypothetical protein [Eubacteriaceae bacterium]
MSVQQISTSAKYIADGHILLVLCIVCYLVWWSITFRPGGSATAFGNICITGAFLFGAAGVIINAHGLNIRPAGASAVPGWYILVGGAVIYVILFAVFTLVFHRRLTTELFLIVGWAAMEICTVNGLRGTGIFGAGGSTAAVCIIGAAAVVSLICYMYYYELEGVKGWIDGMIPLIISGVVMAGMAVAVFIRR